MLTYSSVSTNICEIGAIVCKKNWLKVDLELKNSFWKTQNFGVRSSGEVCTRAGSYVDGPSARAAEFMLERGFDVTSTFAGPKGPLEPGSPRSSGDPVF